MKMHKKRISLGLYLAGMMGLLAFTPAATFAQTAAGTPVTNTATVSFQVGGEDQPDVSDDDTFTVDALVNPVVAATSGTSVTPGQIGAVLPFTVTNGGNQVQDFVLSIEQDDDDSDDLTGLEVYIDINDNGVIDVGTDTLVVLGGTTTPIQNLGIGDDVNVLIRGDVPNTLVDTNTIDVFLIATAYDPGTDNTTIGPIETETSGNTSQGGAADTLFGDGAGGATGDDDENGQHSAENTFTVEGVTISVSKTSAVIDYSGADPAIADAVTGTRGFYVPGATVEYTITVSYSGSASSDATSIVMSDDLPAGTEYVTGSITLNTTTVTDTDSDSDGDFSTTDPATDPGTVTVNIPTRNGGSDADTITFRVTIL